MSVKIGLKITKRMQNQKLYWENSMGMNPVPLLKIITSNQTKEKYQSNYY